jgi:hypothetical protein
MNLIQTLALFALGAALTALFGWLGARPQPLGKPRLAPWQFLMMIAGASSLMVLVHLLNLVGAHTGGA